NLSVGAVVPIKSIGFLVVRLYPASKKANLSDVYDNKYQNHFSFSYFTTKGEATKKPIEAALKRCPIVFLFVLFIPSPILLQTIDSECNPIIFILSHLSTFGLRLDILFQNDNSFLMGLYKLLFSLFVFKFSSNGSDIVKP